MKLAEALLLRADLHKSIDDLRDRLLNNTLVQEGSKPAEDPVKLLDELYAKVDEHEKLVVNINSSNLKVKTGSGLTMTEALARREKLTKLNEMLSSLVSTASAKHDRYSRTEILNVATIDVQTVQKKLDDLAKERRNIEVDIQAANWTNDLITE